LQVIRKIGARLGEIAATVEPAWEHGIDPPEALERAYVQEMFADEIQEALRGVTAVVGQALAKAAGKGGSGNNGKGKKARVRPVAEEGASSDLARELAARQEHVVDGLLSTLRKARAAYALPSVAQPEGAEGGGGGTSGGAWGALTQELRRMQTCKEVCEIAVHRQVVCRLAIETLPPERRSQGAHQQCAGLRRCLAALVHARPHSPLQGGQRGADRHKARGAHDDDVREEAAGVGGGGHLPRLDHAPGALTEFWQWGGEYRRRECQVLDAACPGLLEALLLPLGPRCLLAPLPSRAACTLVHHYRGQQEHWRRRLLLRLVTQSSDLAVVERLRDGEHGGDGEQAEDGAQDGGSALDAAAAVDGQVRAGESNRDDTEVERRLLALEAGDVLLACALWLVVRHSRAASQDPDAQCRAQGSRGGKRGDKRAGPMRHAHLSALAALVAFPRDAYKDWLAAALSKGSDAPPEALSVENLNTCSCLSVVLLWVNALNDALAQPFPRQDLALVSPRLLLALQGVPGGVAAAIEAIWPPRAGLAVASAQVEAARQRWLERWRSFVAIAWDHPAATAASAASASTAPRRKRSAADEQPSASGATGAGRAEGVRRGAVPGSGGAHMDRQGKRSGNIFDALAITSEDKA